MNATAGKAANTTEIGLVLQGGGALGAYEYGGITALLDLIDEAEKLGRSIRLKVVTGVSIGAINAACLVGARDRADARARLKALWHDLTIDALPFVPSAISSNVALWYVPHFYMFQPTLTCLYDTQALLPTLRNRVDFEALNESPTTFAVTAADIGSGQLVRFANKKLGDTPAIRIEPEHVLASGSLAPQFPWTEIADKDGKPHYYWDGGLIDNTPLGDVFDAFSADDDVDRLIVVMNLFPLQAGLPTSFAQVNDRVNQLRFGNRLRQDAENARQINMLISTIEQLIPYAPQPLQEEISKKYRAYKQVNPIEISLSADEGYGDADGFRDFSRDGIEKRRRIGRDITFGTLGPIFNLKAAA